MLLENLIINLLPPYFNYIKPNLPVICNHYDVQNPKFHLSVIKQEFAKQLLQYCLIKLLHEGENASEIADKVGEQKQTPLPPPSPNKQGGVVRQKQQQQLFCTFKSVIKYKTIFSCNNTCVDRRIVSLARDLYMY